MHREMSAEIYYYYFCKMRMLFSLLTFSGIFLVAWAMFVSIFPSDLRKKIFPVLGNVKFSGSAGGVLVYIFSAGIFVRLFNYITCNYWNDTFALADAIIRRPFRSLLTVTLDNMQSAPPLFLLLSKSLGELFGYGEPVLGFIPFAAGVLAMFIFYRLLKDFSCGTILVVMTLFAFNPVLIFYSGEFKQYALDVLFTLVIVWCSIKQKNHSISTITSCALSGVVSVLFSHAVQCYGFTHAQSETKNIFSASRY